MRQKTYFVTDAHLGSGADTRQRELDLVRWLESIEPEAKRVIMLGDIFDFWFTYKYAVPRGFVRLLGKMAEMADRGVEFHFFIGNHDMWMFDYLQREIGAVMYSEPTTMELEGKRFLIGHGDGLWKGDHKYNCLKRVFRGRLNQWLFAGIHPNIGFPIANRWSDSSRRKHSLKDLGYLGDDREGIYLYCKKNSKKSSMPECSPTTISYLVIATPVVRPLGTATYINVGNWIQNRDYAVFDGETCELKSFK